MLVDKTWATLTLYALHDMFQQGDDFVGKGSLLHDPVGKGIGHLLLLASKHGHERLPT